MTRHNSAAAGLLFDLGGGVFDIDDLAFDIPRELTTRGFRAQFFFNTYERNERVLLAKYLPADSTVLELGACLGIVAGVTSRLLDDPSRHLVVEADPRLALLLEANRDRNGLLFGIENGLVTRGTDGTFFISSVILSGSSIQNPESIGRTEVPTTTVEELEAAHGMRFDALVMDIEGGELQFMRENPALLRQLNFVSVELHESVIGSAGIAECEQLMASAGLAHAETVAECAVWLRVD